MITNRKTLNVLLFYLIFNNIVSSQTKKEYVFAKVVYNVNVHLDKNNEIYKIHEKFSPGLVANAEIVAPEIDFSLVFSDSSAIFYLEEKLFSDNRAVKFVLSNTRFYGRIKQQHSNYITEELQEDFGKFLVSRSYQNWELHDETKKIGDYTCFKATTFHTVTTQKGKVFKYNFTAWYSPQLPYKFGPAGYGNLPGLIIELQSDRFTYGVKKIDYYQGGEKNKIEMPTLKNLKLITEEKFEELAAEKEKRN